MAEGSEFEFPECPGSCNSAYIQKSPTCSTPTCSCMREAEAADGGTARSLPLLALRVGGPLLLPPPPPPPRTASSSSALPRRRDDPRLELGSV